MKIRKMKRVHDWSQVKSDDFVVIVKVDRYQKHRRHLLPATGFERDGKIYIPVVPFGRLKTLQRKITESRQRLYEIIAAGVPVETPTEYEFILIVPPGDYIIAQPTMNDVVKFNMVFKWHKIVPVEFDDKLLDQYISEEKELVDVFVERVWSPGIDN